MVCCCCCCCESSYKDSSKRPRERFAAFYMLIASKCEKHSNTLFSSSPSSVVKWSSVPDCKSNNRNAASCSAKRPVWEREFICENKNTTFQLFRDFTSIDFHFSFSLMHAYGRTRTIKWPRWCTREENLRTKKCTRDPPRGVVWCYIYCISRWKIYAWTIEKETDKVRPSRHHRFIHSFFFSFSLFSLLFPSAT